MSREAMQIALEALESDPISHAGLVSRKQAITALRQALETEREWVGLTDDDYEELLRTREWGVYLIEAVEAKLKEKNNERR
ncbi:hypothetical protein EBT31_12585 [bacterium]|jgi:hypothetical protein|nr:hypothetical protein [bacterium]